jgi:hypothetical protein
MNWQIPFAYYLMEMRQKAHLWLSVMYIQCNNLRGSARIVAIGSTTQFKLFDSYDTEPKRFVTLSHLTQRNYDGRTDGVYSVENKK